MVKILAPGESAKTKRVFSVLAGIVRSAMNALIGKTWKGFEALPQGGYILCPNHLTKIDPLVVGHAIYSNGRLPRWLAKDSLFNVPVLGWMLRETGQVPVARSASNAGESLAAAQKVLDAGGVIVIYPEGTLTRDPNLWPMVGRTGAARLACRPVHQWYRWLTGATRNCCRAIPRKCIRSRESTSPCLWGSQWTLMTCVEARGLVQCCKKPPIASWTRSPH